MILTIDFETRSPIDIKKCGMYAYAAHEKTEVMILAVQEDNSEPRVWIPPFFRALYPTEIPDEELTNLLNTTNVIVAHNAGFERCVQREKMVKVHGMPDLPLEKVRCTAAQSLMCGLPRKLEDAVKIVSGGKFKKDMEGHNLMLKMSKPKGLLKKRCTEILPILQEKGYLPVGNISPDVVKELQKSFLKGYSVTGKGDPFLAELFIAWKEDQKDFERLVQYAKADVIAEYEIYTKLPKIPDDELEVWRLDQEINDRGVLVDRESAEGIQKAIQIYVEGMSEKALALTDGEVTSMKSPSSILTWLSKNGIDTISVDKENIEFLLTLRLPQKVREFLEIRQYVGKSSIAKYVTMQNMSIIDGRMRGLLTYHAATTGRWGGSGVQPQNLPRPSETNFVKGKNDKRKEVHADPSDIPLLASQDFEFVSMFWNDPMILAADLIRPMFVAKEGCDFVTADYSAIEGRGLAWLAGEQHVLDGYIAGLDPYKVAASGIYKIPYEQVDGGGKGPQRQIGKISELLLGFGGSWGAFLRFGADKKGLTEEEGREIIKSWRASRPKTTEFWYALVRASVDAMRFKGEVIKCGKISFKYVNNFLLCRLPSGRNLYYPFPKLEDVEMSWSTEEKPSYKKLVTAHTLTATKQWVRRPLSHVTCSENVTQATCRDILVFGMKSIEKAGYKTVLHVHDEIISEVPKDFGSVVEFENLMSVVPPWASGFPIKAEGWRGDRYRK